MGSLGDKNRMTSRAISPYTLPTALAAADVFVGPRAVWSGDPNNREQAEFLETFRHHADIAEEMKEIDRNATRFVDDHISWLKESGWEAQITQGGPNYIFMASVLRIGGFWQARGEARVEDGIHRALLPEVGVFSINDPKPAITVETKDGVEFLMQQVDADISDKKQLKEASSALFARRKEQRRWQPASLDFPMVNLSIKANADHLLGITCGPFEVVDAKEQFRLKLNHEGGLAESAAEISALECCIMKTSVIIDGPFLVTLYKEGMEMTPFAAYCDRDSWGSPDLKL